MEKIQRVYQSIVEEHLQKYANKIILLAGPRQVGKTVLGHMSLNNQLYHKIYLNWDKASDRKSIINGLQNIIQNSVNYELSELNKINVFYFDELHKHRKWKSLLRDYQSSLTDEHRIIVTGSARMEAYTKGRESLKGISILYHVFPISVAEIIGKSPNPVDINEPYEIDEKKWQALLKFGGFPEPYLHAEQKFFNRWAKDRGHQLFHEDLRDLEKSIDVKNIQNLSNLLKHQVKHQIKYNTLADNLSVKELDIKQWISQLEDHYFCFSIQPWHNKPSQRLCSNPKIYLWDWSELTDQGARYENLVAVHLKKAIEFWNDNGGNYEIFYLRSDHGEVDFLLTKDNKPWLMVEVKSSNNGLHSALHHFNDYLNNVPHILQVTGDMPYKDIDCFSLHETTVVPMVTFLSQLV